MLYTVGHGTLEIGELTGLLAEAGISGIIDVRSFPGSRRLPHFAREARAHSVPAAGLGYIVGRKASMPAGTGVVIRVHGPVERTWSVEVGDRATVVDQLHAEPTVTMDLPAMLFLRLTGGRIDPNPHLGTDLLIGGDPELGARLATHLAFTI
jgi:hypothetical protein